MEGEVRRLAPWYYDFELGGVSTTITPPCDHHGHRRVRLPNVARSILVGSTVLDVACSEGGYAFRALDFGARHVIGFDARAEHIEKARFVTAVRGDDNVEFHVATTDEWLARGDHGLVDHVFLCGVLHHLPDPAATIAAFCTFARRGVFVTSLLAGGGEGYTDLDDPGGLAGGLEAGGRSRMPNTTRTVVREFVEQGFLPVHIAENRTRTVGGTWGSCSLYFRRCAVEQTAAAQPAADPVELQVVPRADSREELDIVVYNWSDEALDVVGELVVEDEGGAPLGEPKLSEFTLWPRVSEERKSASESMFLPVEIQRGSRMARATVTDRRTGRVLAERRVSL